MKSLALSIFAAFSLSAFALLADLSPPQFVPSGEPTIEARCGRGGGRGVFQRFRERRQERRSAGGCA